MAKELYKNQKMYKKGVCLDLEHWEDSKGSNEVADEMGLQKFNYKTGKYINNGRRN